MPMALKTRSSGGSAVKRLSTVTSKTDALAAMSRACSAILSSQGSQKPNDPSRGRTSTTAKSAIHQMGGIRRNLSMKLMRSLWLSFAGAAL
jgi:hypothetical protein